METSTIKICGQKVHVGYCYATEIAFHNYCGESVDKFNADNPQHTIYLIMAAVFAYYNAKNHEGEAHELTDEALLYDSKPEEIVEAFKTVLELRQKWYGMEGSSTPSAQGSEEDGKN